MLARLPGAVADRPGADGRRLRGCGLVGRRVTE